MVFCSCRRRAHVLYLPTCLIPFSKPALPFRWSNRFGTNLGRCRQRLQLVRWFCGCLNEALVRLEKSRSNAKMFLVSLKKNICNTIAEHTRIKACITCLCQSRMGALQWASKLVGKKILHPAVICTMYVTKLAA